MKLKVGDQVAVLSGKDKGKSGKITKVLVKQEKIVIEKVNLRTKHIKKTKERAGEKIQFEAPLHSSKAMLICPHCNKRTRVGYKKNDKNKKLRTCKKCKEIVDKEIVKK